MIRLIKWIVMLTIAASSSVEANFVKEQFVGAFGKGALIPPDEKTLQRVRGSFRDELTGTSNSETWQHLAMQRKTIEGVTFIRDVKKGGQGKGLFAFQTAVDTKPWLVQAPHAKSDKYTGQLAALLMIENSIRAAMWNSIPRKAAVQYYAKGQAADMAHLTNTYWQAMTESFAQVYPNGRILQLHGYAKHKRRTAAGADSDMIISAGHFRPQHWLLKYSDCLKKSMPAKVSLFPYDVKELGGTTNAQARLLQTIGFDGFVHIEMSKGLRQKLLKSKELRRTLLTCLS